MIKNMIFDFDGVIVDSFDYHLERYNVLFPDAGVTAQELYDIHLGNFNSSREDHTIWDNVDIDHYDDGLEIDLPQAGIVTKEFKEFFKKLDTKNFIVSSGPEKSINATLEKEEIASNFQVVWGRDTHPSKVHKLEKVISDFDLKKEETIFLTDTVGDVKEAHKVGITSVTVDFGFHNREDLEKENPHAVCSDWDCVQSTINLL